MIFSLDISTQQENFKSNIIIRVTSDCPLIDYSIVNKMLNYIFKE